MNSSTRLRRLLAAAFLTAAGAIPATAGIIYNQPWGGGSTLFASQNDTTGGLGNFATTYDSFSIAGGGTINGVGWTGGYFNPPAQGQITAWTLGFWSDASGLPGALLYTQTTSGTGNETFVSNVNGFPIYTYSLELDNPFNVGTGTEYWLSVTPDLGFPPQWGWATGTGGDGNSYQCYFGSCNPLGFDMAFNLSGSLDQGVPEPLSLGMMGTGLAALALAGFRRKHT
jgi:hypothetical protein